MSRKYSNSKKVSPSFSNFSNYDPNITSTCRPYIISCRAYSVARTTLEEAQEIGAQMLKYYPDGVYITTPEGLRINVEDGTSEDMVGTDEKSLGEKIKALLG